MPTRSGAVGVTVGLLGVWLCGADARGRRASAGLVGVDDPVRAHRPGRAVRRQPGRPAPRPGRPGRSRSPLAALVAARAPGCGRRAGGAADATYAADRAVGIGRRIRGPPHDTADRRLGDRHRGLLPSPRSAHRIDTRVLRQQSALRGAGRSRRLRRPRLGERVRRCARSPCWRYRRACTRRLGSPRWSPTRGPDGGHRCSPPPVSRIRLGVQ